MFINTQGMQDKAFAASLNQRAKELLAQFGADSEKIYRDVLVKLGV